MVKIKLGSVDVLTSLLKWRDQNKDLVRAVLLVPHITEGVITFKDLVEQEFRHEDRYVYHTYKAGGVIEALSFKFDTLTWRVSDVKDLLQWDYPQQHSIQDIITIHASCIAVIRQSGKDIKNAKVITLAEGLNGSLEVLVEC